MTAAPHVRMFIPVPHAEVDGLVRLLGRKTFEIEVLEEALAAARWKSGSGPRLPAGRSLDHATMRKAERRI